MKPVIFGLSGLDAHRRRARLLRERRSGRLHPVQAQLRRPRADARADRRVCARCPGRDDLPILIDQEGGRVARMQPPEWPAFPAGPAFDALYDIAPISAIEAARANAQALGADAGRGRHHRRLPAAARRAPARGDRRRSATARSAASRCGSRRWAARCSTGCARGGVVGVVKHMPGHGRAVVDSHQRAAARHRVRGRAGDRSRAVPRAAGAPMGMTCHVVFEAWDAGPARDAVADRDRATSSAGGSASTGC